MYGMRLLTVIMSRNLGFMMGFLPGERIFLFLDIVKLVRAD